MELHRKIKQRREELNMSQDELAKKIGYKSRSTINKIELGINNVPLIKVSDFANALQISPQELMGDDLIFKEWDKVFNAPKLKAESDILEYYQINSPNVYNLLIKYYELNEDGKKEAFKLVDKLGCEKKYQIERED